MHTHTTRLAPNLLKQRTMKHIADLSLLIGDLGRAFHWYAKANSVSKLKFGDNLWLASVYEGQAVTAIVLKLCEEVLGQKAQVYTPQSTGTSKKVCI